MADFVIVMGAALAGGLIAYRLKVPMLLGYILAGILIGPNALGLVDDIDMVETMASVGVVLLLFTIGMEFSVVDLKRVGPIWVLGGIGQMALTVGLCFVIIRAIFDWPVLAAAFFSLLVAHSSTTVILKILAERREVNTPHGRIMFGISLVQDLSVLPLMVILPALAEDTSGLAQSLGLALGKAMLALGAVAVVGLWIIPRLLRETAGVQSRELFRITILAICLGAAYGTSYFGVSAAFGAFAAGMLVSRSHFAHQALGDIIPFRDAFVALFFISLGMLSSPRFMADNWNIVILVAVLMLGSKFLVSSAITWFSGYSLRTTLFVGAGLAQVGEFAFILAAAGLQIGIMSGSLYSLALSAAIVTLLVSPAVFKLTDLGYDRLLTPARLAITARRGKDDTVIALKETFSNHVIVCGHGRTGSNLASILQRYNIPYVVVEINPRIISELQAEGIPCIYGDAGNPQILSMAHISQARVLALTCPDAGAEVTAASYARQVNRNIDIIAVSPRETVTKLLQRQEISEIVEPAIEASLEFVRHILRYYGVDSREIESMACPFLREREDHATQ